MWRDGAQEGAVSWSKITGLGSHRVANGIVLKAAGLLRLLTCSLCSRQ